jgi:hypothetical protein
VGDRSRQTKVSPVMLPNTEITPSLANAGRRAATITERLCGLYIMVTMNMDMSLIKYYVQSGELQKRFKKCLNGQTDYSDI